MDLNRQQVPVPCANCGFEVKQSIAWIKSNLQHTCPHCGTVMQLDSSQFTREFGKVERAISDLEQAFKKFGKRR
jgi:predicted RNA-binding Zn-ribbon protein involved in translation (DUF1610 family)